MILENYLFSTLLLAGSVFIIAAVIMYIFPPKKINSFYGYRTSSSMKTPERWVFAQKKSTGLLFKTGLVLIACSFIGLLDFFSESSSKVLVIVFILAAIAFILVKTEKEIKKRFN